MDETDGQHRLVGGMARNWAWTYSGVLIEAASGLVVTGAAVRFLGLAEYGLFAVFQAVALLVTVVDLGLGLGVVAAAARWDTSPEPETRSGALADLEVAQQVYLRIGAGVAAVALVLGAGSLLVCRWQTSLTLLLVGVAAAVSVGLACAVGVATGLRRFDLVARSAALGAAATAVVALAGLDILALPALGLAQLAGALVARVVLLKGLRPRPEFLRACRRPVTRGDARRVLALAGPLVFASASTQLLGALNLVFVGVFSDARAVGVFRACSLLPSQAASLLFRGYDVVFPSLAATADEASRERLNGSLNRVAAFLGGLGLGWMVAESAALAAAVLGGEERAGGQVLALFALVWLVNIPAHGLSLLLIAARAQRLFVPLTVFEGVLNVALTVALSSRFGATGAAVASLVTILVSNVAVLPVLARGVAPWTAGRGVVVDGYLRAGAGLAVATAVCASVGGVLSGGSAAATSGVLVLAVGLPVGWFAVGRAGRQFLGQVVRRG